MITKNSKGKSIAYHAFNSPHDLYVAYGDTLSETLKATARRAKELEKDGDHSFIVSVSYSLEANEFVVNLFSERLEG